MKAMRVTRKFSPQNIRVRIRMRIQNRIWQKKFLNPKKKIFRLHNTVRYTGILYTVQCTVHQWGESRWINQLCRYWIWIEQSCWIRIEVNPDPQPC
jgi:hypothetical protein